MKMDRLKKVTFCLAVVDIILTASIGYTIFNLPGEEEDNETLYTIEYTREVEEFNYTDEWRWKGNVTIVHPLLFSNISYIDFSLEWWADIQTFTFNMTITEPPNSTVTYDPNNNYEKTVNNGEVTNERVHIYCYVNDNFKDTWIYASSTEEAFENTTVTNGQGNFSIAIWFEDYSAYYMFPRSLWWWLNVEVHYYEGTLEVGE